MFWSALILLLLSSLYLCITIRYSFLFFFWKTHKTKAEEIMLWVEKWRIGDNNDVFSGQYLRNFMGCILGIDNILILKFYLTKRTILKILIIDNWILYILVWGNIYFLLYFYARRIFNFICVWFHLITINIRAYYDMLHFLPRKHHFCSYDQI